MQYWVLQDAGDREPFAVMSLDDADGLPRRFVPGEGLVHWPSLSAYVVNGEPGARPIEPAEAVRLMNEGVGEIEPGYVALGRGQGPTVQPPSDAAPAADPSVADPNPTKPAGVPEQPAKPAEGGQPAT
jgi:hypothetical protein